MKNLRILMFVLLGVLSFVCLAVDKSVYEGTWQHKSKDLNITLEVNSGKVIMLTVNGIKYTDRIKTNFVWGNPSVYPFLTISFSANDQNRLPQDHLFELVVGSEEPENPKIVGFYEKSTMVEPSEGLLETQSSLVFFSRLKLK